ncbi:MAG: hypothetical protein HC792_04560, partial [Acaryochloridaceae cyanobacterium CSU_5_19]|nr:hypothetical protein [Acaryochloridaceae cyanobacterium CSU_5_19]
TYGLHIPKPNFGLSLPKLSQQPEPNQSLLSTQIAPPENVTPEVRETL